MFYFRAMMWKKKLAIWEAELFACCSLPFVSCSLIVTFCLLIVTFCLWLVTVCSLIVSFGRCSLLFALWLFLFVQLLWAIAWLLVTHVIYLVDKFFTFSSLVLLKEIRKEVSPRFHLVGFVFYGRRSRRFPSLTPVLESSSDLLRAIISSTK